MKTPLLRSLLLALVVLSGVMGAVPAGAHPARMATATARVSADGAVEFTLRFDVPAYVLKDAPDRVSDDAMEALLGGGDGELDRQLREARARFAGDVGVIADGTVVPAEVMRFPSAADLRPWRGADAQRLPAMVEVAARATLPEGTRTVSFRLPEIVGPVVLTVHRPGQDSLAMGIEAGDASPVIPVQLAPRGATSLPTTAVAERASPAPVAAEPAAIGVLGRFVRLGFEHIVPKGADHILFVLGLFFLSPKLRPLLWQVTAFTVAHSITLALSLYGVVRLPEAVVEPLIAASIAFVAIENLFTTELKPWRPAVVFAFGLVHGLGFAGILTSVGLTRGQFFPVLFAFNAGVELGQLAVIAAAFLLVGWFRDRAWYRWRVVVPASVLIGGMGLFWTVQRLI
jgi:hypothetical protein